jgi:translation initiation factor IF-2
MCLRQQKHSNSIRLSNLYLIHTSASCAGVKEKHARDREKYLNKKEHLKAIIVKPAMTIKELALALSRPTSHVVECLERIGYASGQRVKRDSMSIKNLDVIIKVVHLTGYRHQLEQSKEISFEELEKELDQKDDSIKKRPKPNTKDLIRRPPVVTIMGHVDHGKTTLLDALRGSHIVEKEFGGITQHIGAFNCNLETNDKAHTRRSVTILDTPGHAAFNMMRSRGARLTDIVVLVIAAEDGVMAQTVESIEHAKKTGCPIIVAINKIDKVSSEQVNKVKNELLKYELVAEELGGDTQIVPISALKKINLDLLLEEIWTRAEIMELKGDPKGLAEGYVIESTLDLHKGKLASILIQRGSLTKGSYLVAGNSWCKVKFISDENQSNVIKTNLSQVVQVMGWKDSLPSAGDEVLEVTSESRAKEIVEIRHKKEHLKKQKFDLESIKKKREQEKLQRNVHNDADTEPESSKDDKNKPAEVKTLHIIIKADVNGSLEAILNVIETYNHNKVHLDLVHFEVGQIKKSDLEMAEMFDAIIYCFNLPKLESSEHTKIKIRHFNVIYKLFDDLKHELTELLPLVEQEEIIGEADILKVFDYNEKNKQFIKVAGGRCSDGLIDRKLYFRVLRNNQIVYDKEKCKSLKHHKSDVNSIKRNVEFGFAFENESVLPEPGDKIVCYDLKVVKSNLEWNLGF